ncbi:MAG: DUF192 domain-containing protein [Solirubrobacteraceae bacterium]
MKIPILFYLLTTLLFNSCELDKLFKKSNQEKEQLEIEFQKEGALNLINNGILIKNIDIEVASDDYERENGLMHRSKMDENKGMLFLFNEPKIQTFWMKNTRIPLDIIYISESKEVINIAKNTQPFKESGVPSSIEPAKYVLEVNAGSCDKWGVKENVTKINFELNKTTNN